MSTHRIRRPQLYTAMLRDSYSILLSLKEGSEFKRSSKGQYFIFDGYKVHINHEVIEFYRYDEVFMKLHFGKMETEILVNTSTYHFTVQDGTAIGEYEMPISKDEHFNVMMMKDRFPAWEDMEYLNKIYLILKDLGVEFMKLDSSRFYI